MGRRMVGSLAILVAITSSACATNKMSPSMMADRQTPLSMTVRNDNWLDVVIYAVRGTSRIRIGTVGGSSSQTFRLKSQAFAGSNGLQILADPIGSTSRYLSEPVVLAPGQRLELQLGSVLSSSTFAIRNE